MPAGTYRLVFGGPQLNDALRERIKLAAHVAGISMADFAAVALRNAADATLAKVDTETVAMPRGRGRPAKVRAA